MTDNGDETKLNNDTTQELTDDMLDSFNNAKMQSATSSRRTIVYPTTISSIFPDTALAQVIAELLNKDVSDTVLKSDLELITDITANNKKIADLTGLDELTNLGLITANNNNISDLSTVDWSVFTKPSYGQFILGFANNNILDFTPIYNSGIALAGWRGHQKVTGESQLFSNVIVFDLNQDEVFRKNSWILAGNFIAGGLNTGVNTDGSPYFPEISHNGIYDSTTNTITWNLPNYVTEVSFGLINPNWDEGSLEYRIPLIQTETITPIISTPSPKVEVGRTCQDDGYANGYYWNGTACVLPQGEYTVPNTGVK